MHNPVIPAKSLPRTRYGTGIQKGGGQGLLKGKIEPVEGIVALGLTDSIVLRFRED